MFGPALTRFDWESYNLKFISLFSRLEIVNPKIVFTTPGDADSIREASMKVENNFGVVFNYIDQSDYHKINYGTAPNSGNADSLEIVKGKIESNFEMLEEYLRARKC